MPVPGDTPVSREYHGSRSMLSTDGTCHPHQVMKHQAWKERQHRVLRRQMDDFLARGGRIMEVPPGASGLTDGRALPAFRTFSPAQVSRHTPLTDVVATIETRRQAQRRARHAASRKRRRTPRRKLLYDDFGEPLRWVWVDD